MWQSKLEVVRTVETVRVGFGCFGFILLLVSTIAIGPSIVNSFSKENIEFDSSKLDDGSRHTTKSIVVAFWVFLAIVLICLVIEVFLTRTLIAACKSDCESARALKGARLWRNVRIVFLLFYPCSFYFYHQTGLLALLIGLFIYHIMGIIVVHMFIKELIQRELSSQTDNSTLHPIDGMVCDVAQV